MTSFGKGLRAAAAACLVASCGGGGGAPSGPPPTFIVSAMVSGLTGPGLGLVLQLNGSESLGVSGSGGPFTFTTMVAAGSTFIVTVATQPNGETCAVANGGGTMPSANVSVSVSCSPLTPFSIAGLTDPLASQQWHLKNTGQTAFADTAGTAGFDIDVDPVFGQGYSGAGVTVAVVDSGLEIAHEDLAANVVPGGSWNFLNGSTDPTSSATNGDHGTSVAGLIAMANNSVGGIGVAPRARLKGFNLLSSNQSLDKVVNSLGASGSQPNSSDVFVFNESFGISPTFDVAIDPTIENQYISGVTNLRGKKGALYVKAGGNGFQNMGITANANCARPFGPILAGVSCENSNFDPENTIPELIVVGAINASGVKASYSTAGSALWVSAPGGEFGRNATLVVGTPPPEVVAPAMVTTDQSGCVIGDATTGANHGSAFDNGGAPNTSCNYTNGMNGTSSATPVTVGVIALLLEANPALTWRDVKHILASSAVQVDASRAAVSIAVSNGSYVAEPGWLTNSAGFKFHNWYGFGMVDASAAVTKALAYTPGQLGTFTNTGFISSGAFSPANGAIPDNALPGVSGTFSVPGTIGFTEAVQVMVSVTHTFTGDLAIELTSPTNTRSVLKTGDDGFGGALNLNGMVLSSNAFYGENPAGTWTIKIVDVAPGDTGTVTSLKIRVFGH